MSIKDKMDELVKESLSFKNYLKESTEEISDETELNLEDYSLEELQEFVESEEYEQLDELSKKTLGSYVKKATDSAINHGGAVAQKQQKRDEISKFTNDNDFGQSTKTELEKKAKVDFDSEDNERKKMHKRRKGISSAVNKLTKESVEEQELTLEDYSLDELNEFITTDEFTQLDELSKEALTNYVKHASKSAVNSALDGADKFHNKKKGGLDDLGKSDKRIKGINTAVDKLTKESTEEQEQKDMSEDIKTEVTEEKKLDISEDIAALFNGETLDEEFKEKATTIFEAAVLSRVKAETAELDEIYATQVQKVQEDSAKEIAELKEEFAQKLEEQVEEAKNGLVENVDGFLNFIVEQWISDNDVALESGIKAEIAENVITGLHKLFTENFVEVPEEKLDLVAEMETNVAKLTAKLDEQVKANIALNKTINEGVRESPIEKTLTGLTDIDAEKFRDLVEELSFDNADTFESKLVTIKENYFTKKQAKVITTEVTITDEPVEDLKEETKKPQVNSAMTAYLSVINK